MSCQTGCNRQRSYSCARRSLTVQSVVDSARFCANGSWPEQHFSATEPFGADSSNATSMRASIECARRVAPSYSSLANLNVPSGRVHPLSPFVHCGQLWSASGAWRPQSPSLAFWYAFPLEPFSHFSKSLPAMLKTIATTKAGNDKL